MCSFKLLALHTSGLSHGTYPGRRHDTGRVYDLKICTTKLLKYVLSTYRYILDIWEFAPEDILGYERI